MFSPRARHFFFARNRSSLCINCKSFTSTVRRKPIIAGHDYSPSKQLEQIRMKKGFIIDMDGVLYHANEVLPGVPNFLLWLQEQNKKYVFLTNASDYGTSELSLKLERLTGILVRLDSFLIIQIPKEHFYTSALATAQFLKSQTPSGSAFVIGSSGLMNALYEIGYTINDTSPDYVVVGETSNYNFQMIERGVYHVKNGVKLIGTNRDILDRVGKGVVPSTGTLVAPIEIMTNRKAYFVGKPNPLIMSHALKTLGTSIEDTVIIGDRMDTDVQAGLEVGVDTALVLTGVTLREDLEHYAFKPNAVLENVGEIVPKKEPESLEGQHQ